MRSYDVLAGCYDRGVGVPEDEIEYPPFPSGGSEPDGDDTDGGTDEPPTGSDDDCEENPSNPDDSTDSTKAHWGGNSK